MVTSPLAHSVPVMRPLPMFTVPVGLIVIVPVPVKNCAPLVVVPILRTAVPRLSEPTVSELLPPCTKVEPLPCTFTVAELPGPKPLRLRPLEILTLAPERTPKATVVGPPPQALEPTCTVGG